MPWEGAPFHNYSNNSRIDIDKAQKKLYHKWTFFILLNNKKQITQKQTKQKQTMYCIIEKKSWRENGISFLKQMCAHVITMVRGLNYKTAASTEQQKPN